MVEPVDATFGTQLRDWRLRRSFSQLGLAAEAEISQRHLSFLETGRAQPSRQMVLRLAGELKLPPRSVNALLAAAGFAPVHRQIDRSDGTVAGIYAGIERLVHAHAPFPALAIDRYWNLLFANASLLSLMEGVDPQLLSGTPNALVISLHPDGLGPSIANYREWRAHIMHRLHGELAAQPDAQLANLIERIDALPVPAGAAPWSHSAPRDEDAVALTLRLRLPAGEINLLTATTQLTTAHDVALSELRLETFLPADAAASAYFAALQRTIPS